MKIAEILEIADKHKANADCKDCETGCSECFQCSLQRVRYCDAAPEMESKLRAIHELMPEIKKLITQFYIFSAKEPLSPTWHNRYAELKKQMEVWENE